MGIGEILHSWTSKDIYCIEVKRVVFLTTKPTPLVMTLTTSHMVTTRNLFYSTITFWTVSYISLVCCPCPKLLIHCILTLNVTMPLLTTVKANFESTFTPDPLFLAFLEIVITIRTRAPFQIWINVYIYILLKLEVFIIDVLRAKQPDFIPCKFMFALILWTLNLSNLSICYIVF